MLCYVCVRACVCVCVRARARVCVCVCVCVVWCGVVCVGCVLLAAYPEGTAREATEIQNLQLVDGDVTRKLGIPVYMLFPRLFTCPTTRCESFSVEFEVNVIVVFEDQYMVTENFPVVLVR
jgi:hypothetical protein